MNARDTDDLIDRLNELESAKRQLDELERAQRVIERSKFALARTLFHDARDLVSLRHAGFRRPRLRPAAKEAPATQPVLDVDLLAEVAALEAERQTLLDALEAERGPGRGGISYARWREKYAWRDGDIARLEEFALLLGYTPKISVLVPTYNTNETMLRETIESVLAQAYPFWELCIADDASPDKRVRAVIEEYAALDDRIVPVFRSKNGHISHATNSALEVASGDYIALLDHDDVLAPEALFEIAVELNKHPEADMVYSDEDKIAGDGSFCDPFFKPQWSPDSFLSRMYTCHLGVYRTSIAREIGGFRAGFEGSQDYDFVLRFTERTNHIRHVPFVLYHWRISPASTASQSEAKPYAEIAALRALDEALERRGEPGKASSRKGFPGVYEVRYRIAKPGKVSIVIPTRDHGDDVDRCLTSIFANDTYPDFEIVLVDNGSRDPLSLAVFERWRRAESRVRVLAHDVPFNFSEINNYAVAQSDGPYLLLLNNDTEVMSSDWLSAMVEQMQRPSIGAVGAMLLYEDDTVQHAGVIIGVGGVAGHSHKYVGADDAGYFSMLQSVNNYSAVTAACLGIRREVYEQVGGLDESLAIAFNDVDFCLRVQAAGYRNVYLPHVKLRHLESKSRGLESTPEKMKRFDAECDIMKQRWNTAGSVDPSYSPNLTTETEEMTIKG